MLIDFSLGVFYRVPESYYIGVSGLHLIQTKGKPLVEDASGGLSMKLDRTFFINGGYKLPFREIRIICLCLQLSLKQTWQKSGLM